MHKSNKYNVYLCILILILAFVIRQYGINWDQGLYIHPDERLILFITNKIQFFSNLNPGLFNYGTLPFYLLKGIYQIGHTFSETSFQFNNIVYIGRILSIIFDLITTLLIYKISKLLFKNDSVALLGSFLYAIAFFPIQNTHFYTVDTFLTFLTTLLIYRIIIFSISGSLYNLFSISICFSAMIATKFTAIVFWPLLIFIILTRKIRYSIFFRLTTFHILFFVCVFVFMPYSFIDHNKFIMDTMLQISMGKSPYTFPYTLQFVQTIPYWHYLKQIVLWGLGPIISILSIKGLIMLYKKNVTKNNRFRILLFLLFYFWYFLIIGFSSVKFMRYMLPLYPFFAICAGYGFITLKKYIAVPVMIIAILWTLFFINIYTSENTRITATKWMNNTLPSGSSISVEYWDDYLPLYNNRFKFYEIDMYEQPDNKQKWDKIQKKFDMSDYIVISSNRQYVPLSKLNDCKKYAHCYPITSNYYKQLFANKLQFKKIKEFYIYPHLEIGPFKFTIDDSSAEESFTVYDHPKVMIFQKMEN